MMFDEKYDAFIQSFVDQHYDLLLLQREYRSSEEPIDKTSPFPYIPEPNQVADDNYIVNSSAFSNLTDSFIYRFIATQGLVFDIKGHFNNIDGRLLSDIMAENHELGAKYHHMISYDHFFDQFKLKLAFDVFSYFIHRRDNNKEPIRYRYIKPFSTKNTLPISDGIKCSSCGIRLDFFIDYTRNKIVIRDHVEACKLQNEPKSVSVTIKCPSKKLVFLNDPRSFFPHSRPDKYEVSLSATLGCIQETKFYAKYNIGFFFVGNTVVDIMQKDDKITTLMFNDESDSQVEKYKEHTHYDSICCDLWWYTILDYDLYMDLCEEHAVDPDSIEHSVVPVNGDKVKVRHSLAAHKQGHHCGVYSQITVQKSKE